jgi:hypothetical protein
MPLPPCCLWVGTRSRPKLDKIQQIKADSDLVKWFKELFWVLISFRADPFSIFPSAVPLQALPSHLSWICTYPLSVFFFLHIFVYFSFNIDVKVGNMHWNITNTIDDLLNPDPVPKHMLEYREMNLCWVIRSEGYPPMRTTPSRDSVLSRSCIQLGRYGIDRYNKIIRPKTA